MKTFFFLNNKKMVFTKPPLLFVFFGESNSGGIAPNSSATLQELAPRNLQIMNNATFQFEPLDIGTNNLIGHIQLEYAMFNSHGMELQLANKYDANFFPNNEVFLVKAGAGGSKIADWNTGGTYYTNFLSRVQNAIDLLFYENPINIKFMLSLGINDKGVGTATSVYKAGMKSLIQRIKTDFNLVGNFNLSIMNLEFVTGISMGDYLTTISDIATEENVKKFSTSGLTTIADGYHLDYAGMKMATNNFLNSF